jgi:hypothetical protein
VSGGSVAEVLYAPGMEIDPASAWPLSAQLAQLLRELIRSGQLAPGNRVPSEPQLVGEAAPGDARYRCYSPAGVQMSPARRTV